MVRDADNPSSIYSCVHAAARTRAVRGSLTTEVWETYNTTWLELQKPCTPACWNAIRASSSNG